MKPLALLGAFFVLAITWKGGLAQTALSTAVCASEVPGCTACTDNPLGCDTCSVGYVKDGTSCKSCGNGCNNCTTSNGTVTCTNCNSAYFLDNGQCSSCLQDCDVCSDKASCTTCENGYRKLLQGQSCEDCHTNCAICDGPTKCRVCKSGYYLTDSYSCANCPNNCVTCESDTKCTTCANGFYKNNDLCAACGSNCAACSSATACTTCDSGYFVSSTGQCLSCANCNSTCNSGTACSSCDSGYFLQADKTCADCPYNELDTVAGRCLSCNPVSNRVRVLTNAQASPPNTCQYCPENCAACSASDPSMCTSCSTGFYAPNNTLCLACDASCATCAGPTTNDCLSPCATGKYFTIVSSPGGTPQGTCTACNSTCTMCSSDTSCSGCVDGYYVDGTECKACPTTGLDMYNEAQCTACAGPYVFQDSCIPCPANCKYCNADATECLAGQCESGYYLTETSTCAMCDNSCAECSGAGSTACTSCPANNELLSTGACAADCAAHEYRRTDDMCIECNATTLGSDCFGCSSDTVCTTCGSGMRLLANSSGCHDCTSYTTEATCTGGCFWNVSNCLACNSDCKECQDTNTDGVGDADECTECFSDSRFFNNTCFKTCDATCATCYGPNPNQCVTCPANRALQQDGTCESCAVSGCTDCTGDKNFCNVCSQNKTAVDGMCVDCPSVSSVGAYGADFCNVCHFVSTQTRYGRYRPRTCARCAKHCSSCSTNGAGKCDMDMCNTGYVYVVSSMTCRPQDCSSFSSSTTSYECETACATSTTKYQFTGSAPNYCIRCPANCDTCDSTGVCTACGSNYVLNGDNPPQCVPCYGDAAMCTSCGTANKGRWHNADGNRCYECIDNCKECTNRMSCTKCIDKHYLQASPLACTPCSTPCKLCKETDSAEECLDCIAGYYILNRTCTACGPNCKNCDNTGCLECEDEFFPDSNKLCKACPTACRKCATNSSCTECLDTTHYKMSNGQCAGCSDVNCASCLNSTYCSTCKSNYYLDRSQTPACQSCGTNCVTCNDTTATASGCTKCASGFYLDTNKACVACDTVTGLEGCRQCRRQEPPATTLVIECTDCGDTIVNAGTPSSNTYRYRTTDYKCATCGDGCTNCTSDKQCFSCASTHCLWTKTTGETECLIHSNKNCLTCKQESDGTTVTCLTCPATRGLKVCEACAPTAPSRSCQTCTDEKEKCTSCYAGDFLNGDACTDCPTNCPSCTNADSCLSCPAANYFDSAASPKACKGCLSGCADCSSDTTCTSCSTYRYKPQTNTDKCFYCKPGCLNCTASGCTVCMKGYLLQQSPNICKRCTVADCADCSTNIDTCNECKMGYYKESATKCTKCDSNCRRCKGENGTCTECDNGYYLNRQKVCTLCTEPGCGKCGLPPPDCQTCTSNYVSENNGCTKKCYVCDDCKTPTAAQLVACPADKVCRIEFTKTGNTEKYKRTCQTKPPTETCDVFSATNLPTRNCTDRETYCCTTSECNPYSCDSLTENTAAEMRTCVLVLISSYLLSLLARHIH